MNVFSLGSFAEHLLKASVAIAAGAHEGLKIAAELVQKTAQSELGTYQPSVGGYPAWVALSDATLADKEAKGFDVPSPLLRTGELRDSIQYEVGAWEAIIGSTSPIAMYQEFGTARTGWGAGIPPRPFMGPAAYRNKENIRAILGATLIAGFSLGSTINLPRFSQSYNMEA